MALARLLPLLLASGCALAPAASAHAQQRVVTTRHYRIHTDLDAAFSEELARRMDAMYEEYERRLVDFKRPATARPFEVYLFERRADYLRLVGGDLRNTGGVFIPDRNLLAAFVETQGRDELRRTLQHEAFHQFAYTAIGESLPVWLNEGLAQVFEEGLWTGDQFWLGQVPPRRMRELQGDIKANRLVDFKRLLSMSDEQWGERRESSEAAGAEEYNQAWAMTHFLIYAGEDEGAPWFRQRLIDLLKNVHKGEAGYDAFRHAFSDNVRGFHDRFVEWARVLKPSHAATLIERQDTLGDFLSNLRTEGHRFGDIAAFREAVIRAGYYLTYTWGRTESDPSIYFEDFDGKPLAHERLFFETKPGSSLPDLVCVATDKFRLRTRFFPAGRSGELEHETLIETTR